MKPAWRRSRATKGARSGARAAPNTFQPTSGKGARSAGGKWRRPRGDYAHAMADLLPAVHSRSAPLWQIAGRGRGRQAGLRPRGDAAALRERLKEASAGERRELLIAFVRQQAMKTLGITDTIDASRPLRELGLDSLMSVTLVNRLESVLGIRISTVKLIKGPSIAQVVDDILPDLSVGEAKAAETASAVLAAAPAEGRGAGSSPAARVPRRACVCSAFRSPAAAPPFITTGQNRWTRPSRWWRSSHPVGSAASAKSRSPISTRFVEHLVTEMQDVLDRPFAFFGHCLGGLTMYETARRLIHRTGSRPAHLFASGARPPDRILDLGTFEEQLTRDLLKLAEFRIHLAPYAQPDDVFAELIRHFNIQATEQLLDDPELRQLMLPVIRAEFEMALNYDFVEEPRGIFRLPVSRASTTLTSPATMRSAGGASPIRGCRFISGKAPISPWSRTWPSSTV